jgi:hypothetical protein
MKIIALLLMIYTIYLNYTQTNLLREASLYSKNENVKSQLNINIICSYIFYLPLRVLLAFRLAAIATVAGLVIGVLCSQEVDFIVGF